jgi:glutamate 5-kinase
MVYKRVVIKIGTAVLTENGSLAEERIEKIANFVANLKKANIDVIIVTSGAVSAGFSKVQLDKKILANRQALASIGQPYLMSVYRNKFDKFNITISQILIIEADFDSRKRTENAKNTVNVLLSNGVVPIINENDTVATEELAFGDNDQLSAHSTFYFNSNLLIILSDIDGYYNKNPRIYNDAILQTRIYSVSDEELDQTVSPNNAFATGGIVTKLKSAQFLLDRGGAMLLASGFDLQTVEKFLLENEQISGTLFKA